MDEDRTPGRRRNTDRPGLLDQQLVESVRELLFWKPYLVRDFTAATDRIKALETDMPVLRSRVQDLERRQQDVVTNLGPLTTIQDDITAFRKMRAGWKRFWWLIIAAIVAGGAGGAIAGVGTLFQRPVPVATQQEVKQQVSKEVGEQVNEQEQELARLLYQQRQDFMREVQQLRQENQQLKEQMRRSQPPRHDDSGPQTDYIR